ncbi:MAG: hypothetical protein D6819_10235, partial [Gammaproteobacteria bacterium]
MSEALDFSSLTWVRDEIGKGLDGIRRALEQGLESGESSFLEQALRELKQIQGTLEMVGIQGATLLARELEALLQEMQGHPEQYGEEAYEVLMEALLVLSGYLEWSQQHRRDIPVALLPYLNALRQARKAQPFREQDLFNPG